MAKYRSSADDILAEIADEINAIFAPDVGGLLRKKAAAPIKPAKVQEACDHGLFSDQSQQKELFK